MPAERFYTPSLLVQGETVAVAGAELHHLAHVMRVKEGEEIELVNGKGGLAVGRVRKIGKQEALVIIERSSQETIPQLSLILGIPLMRPSKLEWVVEKATELGADAFWIYRGEFSEKEDLSENQMERLLYIAVSAMKQCGRLVLPEIQLVGFKDLLRFEGIVLYGDTRETAPLVQKKNSPVLFITGPERGFSSKEVRSLQESAQGVRLHKNILRAETAPIAAACLLTY